MPIAELGDISLFYRERGEGEPVLGIMGFATDQRFWAAQVPAITAANRFITFDNRGIGRSPGPAPGTVEEMAADAARLLDHLGIDRAIVFGVSMGGTIAQRLVLDHPERVSALILGLTFARPIEYMRREQALTELLVAKVGVDALIDASLLHMFTPRFFEIGSEAIDRLVASFYAEGGPPVAAEDSVNAQLEAMRTHDVLAELGRIRRPTLVFGARMDMMVPCFASEEIAAAIPGAELELFETGHGCMVEEMDAVNARIRRFLDEVAGRRGKGGPGRSEGAPRA